MALSLPGLVAPWSIRSLELLLPGPFTPWSIRFLAHSLPGTLLLATKVLGNFGSLPWAFVLCNFRSHNVYLTVYWTKVNRRPRATLCSIFWELSLSSFCSYTVGLHVKTQINNKCSNENRKIYRLPEQRLYEIWQRLIVQFCSNSNMSL